MLTKGNSWIEMGQTLITRELTITIYNRIQAQVIIFQRLTEIFVSAFIYRPITLQQVIQILLAHERKQLEKNGTNADNQRVDNNNIQQNINTNHNANPASSVPLGTKTNAAVHPEPENRTCYATKCQILRAKGILSKPKKCVKAKYMCAGCLNEDTRHKRTAQIELDLLNDIAPNSTLAPLLEYINAPVSLRKLRQLMIHLPTISRNRTRDDHIHGATRYMANTLGLTLDINCISDNIDPPLTKVEQKQLWRMANFQCRCDPNSCIIQQFSMRNFCQTCRFPVYYTEISHLDICPVCMHNDSWQQRGLPCLACKLATIVYRNPFQNRLKRQMELWLHQEDSDTDSNDRINNELPDNRLHDKQRTYTDEDLLILRNKMFQQSFDEICSRATPHQAKHIFENLSVLQHSIRQNVRNEKRSCISQEHETYSLTSYESQNNVPRQPKRSKTPKNSAHNITIHATRPPLRILNDALNMPDGANKLQDGMQSIASNIYNNNDEKGYKKILTCVNRDDATIAIWQSTRSETYKYDENKENTAMEAMLTDSMNIPTNSNVWSSTETTTEGKQQKHASSNTSHRAIKQARTNRAKLAKQEKKRQQRESETMK